MKTKRSRKWKIPHIVLERRTLYFSSYKTRKLKVKLWWVGARERKKRTFFIPFILSEGNFFKVYVLSQCIVYWIHIQNIHTLIYQKTLLRTLFCLFWKSAKAFIAFLRILAGKKHPKIKLQRLRKIRIWTFGLLVHQINYF